METAVQAAPKTTIVAFQAADHCPSPPSVDIALQADDPQNPHQPPPQAEQALQRTRKFSKRCWMKAF